MTREREQQIRYKWECFVNDQLVIVNADIRDLLAEVERLHGLQAINEGLAERVAAQADQLARNAERNPPAAKTAV